MLRQCFLLALWLIAPLCFAAPVAAPAAQRDGLLPLVRYIDRLGEQAITRGKLPGLAIGIVHQHQILHTRGYGVVEVGRKEAVDEHTAFRLASLSKAFAATVAAQLVQEGALRWDSRVVDPLPTFQLKRSGAAEQLTLRDILSHRVGVSFHAFDRELEADQPYPLLAAKLVEAPSLCAPGECYAYQNIAFSLVGDMVFAATGDFFTHQVERRIFHPLEMYDTTYGRDSLEASAKWARPHVRTRRGWVAVRPKENYYRVPPAAGVNASVSDMAKWLVAQTGGKPDVLSAELLHDLHQPQVRTPSEIRRSGWRQRIRDAHYATGWRVLDYAGHEVIYHAGAVQGYRGMIAMLPEKQFGIVVLWNAESAVPSGIAASALDHLLGLSSRDWTGLEKAPGGKRR